jgi:hypothetical protein
MAVEGTFGRNQRNFDQGARLAGPVSRGQIERNDDRAAFFQ